MTQKWQPYLMILPSLIIFSLFFLYPIGYLIQLSLHDWNFISPDMNFIGLANFQTLFADAEFREVLTNTVIYTVSTVGVTTAISILLALWLNRTGWFYSFLQGAIFSPHVISLVSIALLWMWMMEPDYGLLNWALQLVGINGIPWLNAPETSLFSLVVVAVWKGLGFNTLIFIAGLQSIPKDVYEAADLDDASKFSTFREITLPMLSPTIFFLVIINLIGSFQVFETISIMTQGGPINSTNMLVYYIYEYGFQYFKIGYASAAGVLLLIIISIFTAIYFWLLSKRVHYQ